MNIHELSAIERESIRQFVEQAADDGLLSGRVLDFGAGQQPYRALVEAAGGTYLPFDRVFFGGNVSRRDVGQIAQGCDAVLCTQVLQYVDDPAAFVRQWHSALLPGGHAVVTYPTHWPEIRDDLRRFTRLGMEALLDQAGFRVVRHEQRAALPFDGFELALGYGVVALA